MPKPFPHDLTLTLGPVVVQRPAGDYEAVVFASRFEAVEGGWLAHFVDELDHSIFFALGDTPKDALERLINRHTILNGGVESEAVRRGKAWMMSHFNADGSARPEGPDGYDPDLNIARELSDYKA